MNRGYTFKQRINQIEHEQQTQSTSTSQKQKAKATTIRIPAIGPKTHIAIRVLPVLTNLPSKRGVLEPG